MDAGKLQQAIELYDRFTHEGMDRRDFFARMTLIAGSTAAATSLIAAIAASPAAGAIVPEDDPRLTIRTMTFDSPAGYKAYAAEPR
ncbi:MAG TPA: dienelactone hydrolase family protein, partial [Sphingomicrobium sp.]|nr:dienelactone hydrolase family protein [Sphingomicrobium sp.]